MPWLVDTNIISETRRLKPEPRVLNFIADHPLEELYISVVTLAELRFGIELLTKGDSRREELNRWAYPRCQAHVCSEDFADH